MIHAQFIRYLAIGIGLNAGFYIAYLTLTWVGMGSKSAMTVTFSIGLLVSFLVNHKLIFGHRGDRFSALGRFIACYAVLYVINFAALWFFSDRMGMRHQIIQACVILIFPLLAFLMQKNYVFPSASAMPRPK